MALDSPKILNPPQHTRVKSCVIESKVTESAAKAITEQEVEVDKPTVNQDPSYPMATTDSMF